MVKTCVWVQAPVLGKALGKTVTGKKLNKSSSSDLDLDRSGGEWGWILCNLLKGDISALRTEGSTMGVHVIDEDSEYNGESVTIPYELMKSIKGEQDKVLMANEWTAQEAEAGSNPTEEQSSSNHTSHRQSDNDLIKPPDDMIRLTHLHEASVIHCLKRRYENNCIYTSTGPILLALNPFKSLPSLYDDAVMSDYWLAGEKVADLNLKPHIFQSSHEAFRSMMQALDMKRSGMKGIFVDQSMLVSGESGAGKTVSTKYVMKYLATLSKRKAEHSQRRRAASPGRSEPRGPRRTMSRQSSIRKTSTMRSFRTGALVEERILESNPILEAFGNARTVRNDNSSRFGKFIELQFKETGSLIGARIETYLLEKVRLVHQAEGERNFHIFYEFLAAADTEERQDYLLGDYKASHFKLTNSSGTYDRRDGVDDVKLFDELVFAMESMGFERENQEEIFSCCAAFLHASNLTFTAPTEDSSKVDDTNPHLEPMLKLLGIKKEAFDNAMTAFEIDVGQSSYTRELTVEGAEKTLEAFIKGTYGAMFSFIVQTVNKKIDYKAHGVPSVLGKAATISVLDIFGFESFEYNSFEQLCINYCNEALQQQFNRFIFKREQEEYKKEGIKYDSIKFPDNVDVLDLIDKSRTGMLSMLTDQCRTKGTDKSFLNAIFNQYEKHDRFFCGPLHKGKGEFIINHYAGAVKYNSADFVEKNKDETPRRAAALLESSTNELVQLLGKIVAGRDDESSGSGRPKKRPTVASQFSSQLADLRRRIDSTSPHYIRCLKPNHNLKPDEFAHALIADQLRYAGVLEAIRVSRVTYSQRYTHENFFDRYHVIAKDQIKNLEKTEKIKLLEMEITKMIKERKIPESSDKEADEELPGIQRGNSKVFLRQSVFNFAETLRTQRIEAATIVIQKIIRGYMTRARIERRKRSVITAQSAIRRFLAQVYYGKLRMRIAATRLQAYFRMALARRIFVSKKFASTWLQKFYRGRVDRKHYKVLYERKKRELDSAIIIQCMFRVRKANKIYDDLFRSTRKALRETPDVNLTIQSDRAAAIATEHALQKSRQVDNLQHQLDDAMDAEQKARVTLEELKTVKAELQAALAALETAKATSQEASDRADRLEKENRLLKDKLKSGNLESVEIVYSSSVDQDEKRDDESDLKALNERLRAMVARSQQSKKEIKAMAVALEILK